MYDRNEQIQLSSDLLTFLRCRLFVVCCSSLVAAAGCNSAPPTAPVHGRVTYKGDPVTTGTITFHPNQKGPPAVGQIQPDGAYTLARKIAGDGVPLGEYTVTIEAIEVTSQGAAPSSLEQEIAMAESGAAPARRTLRDLVPLKYSAKESSGLTATVKEGDNEIDFDLP